MIIKLNGYIHGYRDEERYTDDLVRSLATQSIRVIMYNDHTIILRASYKQGYIWWTLSDNGGELNLWKINHDELWSIPFTHNNQVLNPATMMYRILAVMRGEKVDWEFRVGVDLAKEGEDETGHVLRLGSRPAPPARSE